jgi:hypothetical protein
LNIDGDLREHRSKEYTAGMDYSVTIARNFYGFKDLDIIDENGKSRGNIPYPMINIISLNITGLKDLEPKLYIDPISGKPYGLDRRPL